MLVRFQDKYFNYVGAVKGDNNDEGSNGLAIRAFELIFCADLCATYVFEMANELLKKMGFKGIYRDNGIMVFQDRHKRQRITIWLHRFQKKITSLATIDEEEEEDVEEDEINVAEKVVKVKTDDHFLFLDMKLT
eukprot:10263181-Ditylum_brightwellii.AAC.2